MPVSSEQLLETIKALATPETTRNGNGDVIDSVPSRLTGDSLAEAMKQVAHLAADERHHGLRERAFDLGVQPPPGGEKKAPGPGHGNYH